MQFVSATHLAGISLVIVLMASGPALGQQPDLQTCTEVHTYCLKLCGNGQPTPPPTWTCEANRCTGLAECLATGQYKMGTQFGHHAPNRTSWGPFQKK